MERQGSRPIVRRSCGGPRRRRPDRHFVPRAAGDRPLLSSSATVTTECPTRRARSNQGLRGPGPAPLTARRPHRGRAPFGSRGVWPRSHDRQSLRNGITRRVRSAASAAQMHAPHPPGQPRVGEPAARARRSYLHRRSRGALANSTRATIARLLTPPIGRTHGAAPRPSSERSRDRGTRNGALRNRGRTAAFRARPLPIPRTRIGPAPSP